MNDYQTNNKFEWHIEPILKDESHPGLGCLAMFGTVVLIIVFILASFGKVITADEIFIMLFVGTISSLIGFFIVWLGAGVTPNYIRIFICLIICTPFLLARDFQPYFVTLFFLTMLSSTFWVLRIFGWRVTSCKNLIVKKQSHCSQLLIPYTYYESDVIRIKDLFDLYAPDATDIQQTLAPRQFSMLQIFSGMTVFAVACVLVRAGSIVLRIDSPKEFLNLGASFLLINSILVAGVWATLGCGSITKRYTIGVVLLSMLVSIITMLFGGNSDQIGEIMPFVLGPYCIFCVVLMFFRAHDYRLVRLPNLNTQNYDNADEEPINPLK